MTIFSHEQAVVFNRVRYTSKKRQKIAVDRTKRQTEIDDRQATVKKVTSEMTEMQEDVVQEQKVVARQQEKLAREEAEIAYEQEVIAQEQAEIIQKEVAITEGLERIAREQSAILKVNGAITKLSTVDAGLQTDVLNSLDSLDEYGALKSVLLDFEATYQTIFWGNNCFVQLTKQQYDMVEVLYHAPTCQMSITSLEEKVWGEDALPTTATAKMAVSRLNKKLKVAGFPFEVLRIKRDLTTVPAVHPVDKVIMMTITTQPETEVYELVRR
jgi:hypothetical protein